MNMSRSITNGTTVKDYEDYLDFDEEPQARTEHEKGSPFVYQRYGFFRAAIPIMPLTLAVLCCMLNFVVPGSGTFLSAASLSCCSDSRDRSRWRCFYKNLLAAILQFLLSPLIIGFIWSVLWGFMFIQIARNWFISDLDHRTDCFLWCPCINDSGTTEQSFSQATAYSLWPSTSTNMEYLILAAGINEDRTGLLRPFREIQQRGILLGEIDDDLLDLFYERCHVAS
ncbi:unnamed protein product [Caenorhabditis sp. 36 PRJEB53466]|nr:unnamed protein product [Caenorhabditis sp. 36 PRJEB53466]